MLFRKFVKEIDIQNRTYLLKTYKQCFIGTEAVDWILQSTYLENREEAVELGNIWLTSGMISHVTGDHELKDKPLFYTVGTLENDRVPITFRAWDFGGQEVYYTTHQFFLTKHAIYLVVFDLRFGYEKSR